MIFRNLRNLHCSSLVRARVKARALVEVFIIRPVWRKVEIFPF